MGQQQTIWSPLLLPFPKGFLRSNKDGREKKEVLRMENIVKVYSNGVMANKGINFSVLAGEIHALSGENGAGKSTLMKIIFGEEQPTSGDIYVNGEKKPSFLLLN